MKRLIGAAVAAAVLLGCQDREQLTSPSPGRISAAISDGGNGGNTHFYFLPPLVTQPSYIGTFNPSLKPLVEICHLTTDPNCANFVTRFTPSQISVDSQYKVNWNTDPSVLVSGHTYRVRVILGNIGTGSGSACPAASGYPAPADRPGCKEFGFRDVKPVATPQEVPKDQSVALYVFLNGSTNPIKFRIEKGALCVANATDCGEGTVGTGGGSVLANFSNLSIPNGALTTVGDVTIIMQKVPCTAAGRVSFVPADLPQYEGCYDFRTFPENVTFNQNYIVGMCLKLPTGLSQAQQDKLQIHRYDPGAPPEALPEAAPQFPLNCTDFASLGGNPVLNFARRTWRAFQREVGPWFSPPPLFAAHLLGGSGGKLSSLVWAIPSGMAKLAGDNQTALVNTAVAIAPSVKVTDPAGDPVAGATVHFVASGDSKVDLVDADSVPCLSDPGLACVRTNSSGIAQVASWTLGSTAGTYTLAASGVGLASSPTLSGDLPTGTLTFTATACKPGFGTPSNIDGVMAPGEWDCALHQDFSANLSGGSSAPATLFWMNDGTNLYLAVRVRRSSTDKVNTLQFNFDNNNSSNALGTGAAETGDDILIFDPSTLFSDNFLTLKCTTSTQSSCGATDVSAGGTKNGAGSFKNQGGFSVYEMKHPLNVGDVGHDFALAAGGKVGLFLTLQLGSGAQGNTQWPGFRKYLTVTIAQP
jgi:hypothetical protein